MVDSLKRSPVAPLLYGMKPMIVALALAACTSPDADLGVVESAFTPGDQDCPLKDCGTNSTIIDGIYFSDINLNGLPNASGLVLDGYKSLPDKVKKLALRDGRLVGVNDAGERVAEGAQLLNTQFKLRKGDKVYIVRIAQIHRSARYWAANQDEPVVTYRFEYTTAGQNSLVSASKPLCANDDESGALGLEAVVFGYDRYDAASKDVNASANDGWVNIACLGGAPAKMHLMRHTRASQKVQSGITTTEKERQALFNAWTANYCGDGRAFTKPGEPLRMRDSKGWLPHDSARSWSEGSQVASYEAIWDENGAVCLNVPRRADDVDDLRENIVAWCQDVGHPIPKCSDSDTTYPHDWQKRGHILTANPVPNPVPNPAP
ncbi:MAG TPA: ADYC domain-containing protein [Kofleriaceae bacterium]|nr:ADYC domain-containing protein [Kofleriaceae bacterium]